MERGGVNVGLFHLGTRRPFAVIQSGLDRNTRWSSSARRVIEPQAPSRAVPEPWRCRDSAAEAAASDLISGPFFDMKI